MEKHIKIRFKVGGKEYSEELHVSVLPNGNYLLMNSPSWIQGLAAADEFVLSEKEAPGYLLVRRGGNVVVQMYFENVVTSSFLEFLRETMGSIGARLDGGGGGSVFVFTVSVNVGFERIENTIKSLRLDANNGYWQYGNVYDHATMTPLNWW